MRRSAFIREGEVNPFSASARAAKFEAIFPEGNAVAGARVAARLGKATGMMSCRKLHGTGWPGADRHRDGREAIARLRGDGGLTVGHCWKSSRSIHGAPLFRCRCESRVGGEIRHRTALRASAEEGWSAAAPGWSK